MVSRREMLRNSSLILAGATVTPSFSLWDFNKKHQFRIGACDWSIGKTSDITGLSLAKEIGLQGLQVSLGTLKNNMHLRQKSLQQEYLDLSKSTGVKITSLAIGNSTKCLISQILVQKNGCGTASTLQKIWVYR